MLDIYLLRRIFLKSLLINGAAIPLFFSPLNSSASGIRLDALDLHIFSKNLQFLDFHEMSEVLPEAINELRAGRSACKMITTNVESVNNALDRDIITAASQSGVQYYRTNWYKYLKGQPMVESLKTWQEEINKTIQKLWRKA